MTDFLQVKAVHCTLCKCAHTHILSSVHPTPQVCAYICAYTDECPRVCEYFFMCVCVYTYSILWSLAGGKGTYLFRKTQAMYPSSPITCSLATHKIIPSTGFYIIL